MSAWGKIIGGMAGLALGGPLGAVLGTVAGHAADARSDDRLREFAARLSAAAEQIKQSILRSETVRRAAFAAAMAVRAGASGRPLTDAELAYIRTVSDIFGFDAAAFESASATGAVGEADPYAVLGVPPTAGDEDIKAAYRRLIRENHPDRLTAEGLPEELVAQANRRMAAINAAYGVIRRARGFA